MVAGINPGNCPAIESIGVNSSIVAVILLMKCTLIGIKMLSVFKYNMHMQIPNKNALNIPPKSCPIANRNDETIIAGIMPILIFILLNKTPLKTNSSKTGANIMDEIALKRKAPAEMLVESMS